MAGSSIAPDQAAHELPRYAVDRTIHFIDVFVIHDAFRSG